MSLADLQRPAVDQNPCDRIFPLPLTVLEAFMIADDRPDYPMMCDLELQFQGSIERGAFECALQFALARNPLLMSLVEPHERGLAWVPSTQRPAVDWAPLGTPLGDDYGTFTDLKSRIGLRVWVRQGDDRATVLLHFHHACCDGLGGFGFIEDLLAGYANALGGDQAISPRPLELESLLRRGAVGPTKVSLPRQIVGTVLGAVEGIRFFLQKPLPLAAAARGNHAPPGGEPNFMTMTCPEHVAAGLRRTASAAGASVNDVLLRDLFLVLRDWNTAQAGKLGCNWLRILMPQNLRDRNDRRMPATNRMSFAFIGRRANQCDAPQQLLDSIRVETDIIDRGKLSLYFLGALAAMQSAGLLDRILQAPRCLATAVLTNLSDPARRFVTRFPRSSAGLVVGNLIFEGVTGGPPLRPLTRAALSVHNSARSLSVSCRLDRHLFSRLDVEHLLSAYVAQLQSTAESAPAG